MRNLACLGFLVFISLNCFAELPANQSQALREQIYSRINAPSPGTTETMELLNNILNAVKKRLLEAQPAIKSEIVRATSELNVFTLKNRNPFNPVRSEIFRKRAEEVARELCCAEPVNRKKPKGG